jgi:hypothetical protein
MVRPSIPTFGLTWSVQQIWVFQAPLISWILIIAHNRTAW